MIVLDTNAAMAMVRHSVEGEAMISLMVQGEKVVAPSLLHAELAHSFYRYLVGGYTAEEEAQLRLSEALSFVDEFIPDSELTAEALHEAARLKHSSYDMFYFVLARRLGATLFTLDKKLMRLCEENGVECIHRITLE